MLRHDRGIVLRSYPFGEADRIVVLVSPHNGKLRTVAKGVRKTTSRFGARLEPQQPQAGAELHAAGLDRQRLETFYHEGAVTESGALCLVRHDL